MTPGGAAWPLERAAGPASGLLAPWPHPAAQADRCARLCRLEGRPTVVLGSAQGDGVVDAAKAHDLGVDVARRGAGGGAIVVAPGAQVWLDVWVPRDDPLWEDDVVRSSWWLGERWCGALGRLGVRGGAVHRARAVSTAWSDVVCFAGVGPGEVTVEARKLVGLAQRRTRAGARLYTMASLRWEPALVTAVLARAEVSARRGDASLAHAAIGLRDVLGAQLDDGEVIATVEDALTVALT